MTPKFEPHKDALSISIQECKARYIAVNPDVLMPIHGLSALQMKGLRPLDSLHGGSLARCCLEMPLSRVFVH